MHKFLLCFAKRANTSTLNVFFLLDFPKNYQNFSFLYKSKKIWFSTIVQSALNTQSFALLYQTLLY